MNWSNPDQVRAYKSGYMRGIRMCSYKPNQNATDLARLVMLNEMMRHARQKHKRPRSRGNKAWRELA